MLLFAQPPSGSPPASRRGGLPGGAGGILGYYSGPGSTTARVNMTVWATTDPAGRVWKPAHRVASVPSQAGMYSCLEDLSALSRADVHGAASATTGVLWETTLPAGEGHKGGQCDGPGCNIVFTSF